MLISDFLFIFLTSFNIFLIFVCRRLLNIFQYFFRSFIRCFSDFLFMSFLMFNIFIFYNCRRICILFLFMIFFSIFLFCRC
uniref:Candidate secreted effector n=1 Tax=Meloidogyne incognita TaxID=6306 RepID=A0A914N1B6_MELIC